MTRGPDAAALVARRLSERFADAARLVTRLPTELQAFWTMIEAGAIGPDRADRLWSMFRALERYGPMGGVVSAAAVRHGNRLALVDESGSLTFDQMDRRSNAVANALRVRGVQAGTGVAIMCRNHRGIFDASFGALKAGARTFYLNTDFAGPQAKEVCAREGVEVLIYDEEFSKALSGIKAPKGRFLAWQEGGGQSPSLESLIAAGNADPPPAPASTGEAVILTSGTTGTPKGATRGVPKGLSPMAAVLSRIPFRSREVTYVAPPVYHAWGFGMSTLAFGLGSTLVMRRRFDPEEVLIGVAEHRATALIVVPVMLSRLAAVGPARVSALDLSALRIIASSGSQLPAALAIRAMDLFGDILYNLYGSTEVAWATIATPEDMQRAPGTAGKPPLGTEVRIYDGEGRRLSQGETGRIFVGSGLEFSGYTGGGTKEVIDGLMSTGDVGHFDSEGRLFVDGRDDEMIVSGGENVFPREIEELLSHHDSIADVAAIGVDDEEFGQRLRAFVVVKDGHQIDADEVKAYVRANLARFKVPRDVFFVEELPRNPSGKILKRELAAQ